MKKISDIQELRQIQLEILDDIDKFCQENALSYFLSAGSLLGAVRHGGFIPWDDDVDIYMRRADYDKFIVSYDHDQYKALHPEKDVNYYFGFTKVIDTRTRLNIVGIEGMSFGVFVDIYPLDYVPDGRLHRKIVFRTKELLYKIRRCKLAKSNPLRSRLAWQCYRRVPIPVSVLNRLIRWIIVSKKVYRDVCSMADGGATINNCFPAIDIVSQVDIPFENRIYKTMTGYKDYLEHLYGDYMTPPPEDQRITNRFDACWL